MVLCPITLCPAFLGLMQWMVFCGKQFNKVADPCRRELSQI